MERISVFHRKFPDSNQSSARTGFVSEFSLNLIYHKGIFSICSCYIHSQMNRCFFVCHSQNHIAACAVFKSAKLTAYRFKTTRGLPQCRRHNNREQNLLTVYPVHFLTQYFFYFILNALRRSIQRI